MNDKRRDPIKVAVGVIAADTTASVFSAALTTDDLQATGIRVVSARLQRIAAAPTGACVVSAISVTDGADADVFPSDAGTYDIPATGLKLGAILRNASAGAATTAAELELILEIEAASAGT